jgi:hypothetical protein
MKTDDKQQAGKMWERTKPRIETSNSSANQGGTLIFSQCCLYFTFSSSFSPDRENTGW